MAAINKIRKDVETLKQQAGLNGQPDGAEQAKKASGFLIDISRLPEDLTEDQREAEEKRLIKKYGFKTNAEGVVILI